MPDRKKIIFEILRLPSDLVYTIILPYLISNKKGFNDFLSCLPEKERFKTKCKIVRGVLRHDVAKDDVILILNKTLWTQDIDKGLISASRYGNTSLVEHMIGAGGDIHAYNDKSLIIACQYGCLQMVKYLISQRADIHTQDEHPLRIASGYGHLDIVSLLIDLGANINAMGDYALRTACRNGRFPVVKHLVENKAFVGDAAIQNTCRSGCLDILQYLVEHGGNLYMDALSNIERAIYDGYPDIIRFIIETTHIEPNPLQALRYAIERGHLSIVQYIMQRYNIAKSSQIIEWATYHDQPHIKRFLDNLPWPHW